MRHVGLALAGAVAGAIAGSVAFVLLMRMGLYGLMIPGLLIGVGAGMARSRSAAVPVACGLLAAVTGILCEWYTRPFTADDGLAYFVTHLHELTMGTWVFLVIGIAAAVWCSLPRRVDATRGATSPTGSAQPPSHSAR